MMKNTEAPTPGEIARLASVLTDAKGELVTAERRLAALETALADEQNDAEVHAPGAAERAKEMMPQVHSARTSVEQHRAAVQRAEAAHATALRSVRKPTRRRGVAASRARARHHSCGKASRNPGSAAWRSDERIDCCQSQAGRCDRDQGRAAYPRYGRHSGAASALLGERLQPAGGYAAGGSGAARATCAVPVLPLIPTRRRPRSAKRDYRPPFRRCSMRS